MMKILSTKDYQTYNKTPFTKVNLFLGTTSSAFLLNFLPGQSLPAHQHPGQQVYLLVLEGTGTFIVDEQKLSLTASDVMEISDRESLSIFNDGDDRLSVYVVISKINSDAKETGNQ